MTKKEFETECKRLERCGWHLILMKKSDNLLNDSEWISQHIAYDYDLLHDFIERVGIILDSIDNPSKEQLNSARKQAFLEIF